MSHDTFDSVTALHCFLLLPLGNGPLNIHATKDSILFIRMPTYYKKTNGEGVQVEDTRIAVVMVGLPARGKSLIAQKSISVSPALPSAKQRLTVWSLRY